jgi:predicted DsbA family dithiol-disulfide isomerase
VLPCDDGRTCFDTQESGVQIEVHADIACPWCYIGEHRLRSALEQRPELAVRRHWRPFQLRPELPDRGEAWDVFVRGKFGGGQNARMAFEHVSRAGALDGIRFRFDSIASAPNTRDAHRLVLLGAEVGREWRVVDDLFRAYFSEGADLNDRDTLVRIGTDAGLNPERVRRQLEGDAGLAEVRHSQHRAAQLGIRGVPLVVLDGRIAISGAQPAEVFVRALDRAAEVGGAAP